MSFDRKEDVSRAALAAIRMLIGTAGGGPRRKVDTSDSSAYTGLVCAWLNQMTAH